MTQALNFTTEAIEAMAGYALTLPPMSQAGVRFVEMMLRQAEVIVLPDYGQLFTRDEPPPETDAGLFKPPFGVTALEYTATPQVGHRGDRFTPCPSSKRIALAWHSSFGWPFPGLPEKLDEGVIVASIYQDDASGLWMPTVAAWHLSFTADWIDPPEDFTDLREELIESGRVAEAIRSARSLPGSLVLLAPDILEQSVRRWGPDEAMRMVQMDLMDEVNAYMDICRALACSNVTVQKRAAPSLLNKSRIKAGKPPLREYHILNINTD